MYAIKKYIYILSALSASIFSGCYVYRAPSGWLPDREKVASNPYGGWLYIEYHDRGKDKISQGEFIGITDTTIFLLNINGLERVPKGSHNIKYVSFKINDDNRGLLTLWAFAGAIATPFVNGWYSIFTWPFWLIGAPIAAGAEAASGAFVTDFPTGIFWRKIAPYSRFPQGIPEGLDLENLKPRSKIGLRD